MGNIDLIISDNVTIDIIWLREQVFVREQGVSREDEFRNDDKFVHFALYQGTNIVACCRVSIMDKQAIIDRVAVSKVFRRKGFGSYLLNKVHEYIIEQGADNITLSSEIIAIPFYRTLGYTEHGDEYLEDGIKCIKMQKTMAKTDIKITFDATKDTIYLREQVFVHEQDVTMDEEHCDVETDYVHFALYCDDQIVATCRLHLEGKEAHIGRVAVSKIHRKHGYGATIMTAAHDYAKKEGVETVIISSQTHAIPFYNKLGYTAYGDEYLDARIPHYDMKKVL